MRRQPNRGSLSQEGWKERESQEARPKSRSAAGQTKWGPSTRRKSGAGHSRRRRRDYLGPQISAQKGTVLKLCAPCTEGNPSSATSVPNSLSPPFRDFWDFAIQWPIGGCGCGGGGGSGGTERGSLLSLDLTRFLGPATRAQLICGLI